jgi:hypothetical protein
MPTTISGNVVVDKHVATSMKPFYYQQEDLNMEKIL